MNCNPTLTADEFKTIHNALCELDFVKDQLEDVLNKDLFIKLTKAANDIRKGLANAYEQDNNVFETKMEHFSQVQQELGLQTVWSIYEVDNLSERHPYEGATTVVYKDWNTNKDVVVQVNGLTWAALYVAANAAIRNSTDNHHIYIEGFQQSSIDPTVLFLSTGS
jgi:hypothetical protein